MIHATSKVFLGAWAGEVVALTAERYGERQAFVKFADARHEGRWVNVAELYEVPDQPELEFGDPGAGDSFIPSPVEQIAAYREPSTAGPGTPLSVVPREIESIEDRVLDEIRRAFKDGAHVVVIHHYR